MPKDIAINATYFIADYCDTFFVSQCSFYCTLYTKDVYTFRQQEKELHFPYF